MTAVLHFAGVIARVGVRILRLFDPIRLGNGIIGGVLVLKWHWRLALVMARRELSARYAGQIMGSFWIVAHPLLQMLVFVYLFAVVFVQRMEGSYELPHDYTVYILSGLVSFLTILPALTTSCFSIVSNATLVKQFKFELEVLPVKDVLITYVFWVVGVLIVMVYTLWTYGELPWTYVLLPALLVIQSIFLIGCAWLASAFAVFFRDLKDIIGVWANLGVYLVPAVYLPQSVPAIFRPFVYSNPLSCFVWIHQDVLYFGRIEHPVSWVLSIVLALFTFGTGYRVFQRLRPLFGSDL